MDDEPPVDDAEAPHAGDVHSRAHVEVADDEHVEVERLLELTAEDGVPHVRVWNPLPQVAFGRRDLREEGYEVAVEAAESRGLAATERTAGGRAVVHTGSTAAFAVAEPAEAREGVRDRYCRISDAVEDVLAELDVDVDCHEPDSSFCPGDHSLSTSDGKVVGVAQRVVDGAALVSGVVLVDDLQATVDALDEVYAALGLSFDPDAVSTLRESNPDVAVGAVLERLEEALAP